MGKENHSLPVENLFCAFQLNQEAALYQIRVAALLKKAAEHHKAYLLEKYGELADNSNPQPDENFAAYRKRLLGIYSSHEQQSINLFQNS